MSGGSCTDAEGAEDSEELSEEVHDAIGEDEEAAEGTEATGPFTEASVPRRHVCP